MSPIPSSHEAVQPLEAGQTSVISDPLARLDGLLNAAFTSDQASVAPYIALQHVLDSTSLTTYELIRLQSRCWKSLSDRIKAGQCQQHDHVIDNVSDRIKATYTSLLDLLPLSRQSAPALIDGSSRKSLSHGRLAQFVRNFNLPTASAHRRVVALAVPNGPLSGLLSFAIAAHYTLAPLNASGGIDQFRADVLASGAKSVLVLSSLASQLDLDDAWARQHDIDVYIVEPTADMTCNIIAPRQNLSPTRSSPNGPDDNCILLFTSGTTGTKKLVPVSMHSLVSAVAFIGDSWRLSHNDVCLNMMPFNHIGGLLRNLFAPLLLGGSTICCAAFDPNQFWDIVLECSPTWYYASPSIHSVILDEAPSSTELSRSTIRMVCNAAGGLLPSLATRLKATFGCVVLPSYGMTECMPISTPPFDWGVEKIGTSGVSVGPEIAILDDTGERRASGKVGSICVRGNPVFPGYLVNGQIDKSAFDANGWFHTGDLGYMDSQGYLYITGRSKEVINRGGEIISPFEIEEAILTASRGLDSPIYGRVQESLAFSVPHETLQETVGIVLVTPPDQPRADIRQLHEAVKSTLHSTKWPVVIVYMQDVPRRGGKVCRSQLGQRLGFESMRDDARLGDRHSEAVCPPADTAISAKIVMSPCSVDGQSVIDAIKQSCEDDVDVLAKVNVFTGFVDVVIAPRLEAYSMDNLDLAQLKTRLAQSTHGYLLPSKIVKAVGPFPRDMFGNVNASCIDSFFLPKILTTSLDSASPDSRVRSIFSELLSLPEEDIFANSDFFELGGDSLRAGKLLSVLRKEFGVRIRIDELFTNSTVDDITRIIGQNQASPKSEASATFTQSPGSTSAYSSSNPLTLLIQLMPITVLVPLRKAFVWFIFLEIWAMTLRFVRANGGSGKILYLLISMGIARTIQAIIMPLIAIAAKWMIVGTYRQGVYPMWANYHLRWWLTCKIIDVCDMGMFGHFNWSRVMYYRLMGARIGKNVTIQPNTVMGEYDLLEIGDNAELDRCICRGFAVEHNTSMYLGRIRVGRNAAAGLKSVVAPGTEIPDDVCIGINSSSWEWKDADGSNYDRLQSRVPQPHWLLRICLILPIVAVFKAISLLPWLAGLSKLGVSRPDAGTDTTLYLTSWFANPTRIGFHFLARTLHLVFAPILFLALTIWLKRTLDLIFGKMQPSLAQDRSQLDRFRSALIAELIPNGNLSEVTGLFGTHYEMTSKVVRALGGKVGKNVYWPGNGPSVQSFDFIDIGDDVVFGSYAHIITSDGVSSDYVRIADGAMVADRVVLLPGNELGQQAVLGSGTLTLRNDKYAPETTWIGSLKGGPVRLNLPSTSGTSSPSRVTSPKTKAQKTKSSKKKRNHLRTGSFINDIADLNEKFTTSYHAVMERYSMNLDAARQSIDLDLLTDETPLYSQAPAASMTPFGRAFYGNQASYRVWSLPIITAYCILTNIFVTIYWATPTVLGLQMLSGLTRHPATSDFFTPSYYRPVLILAMIFVLFLLLNIIFTVVAMAIVIAAKWLIMGRRKPGMYDWDQSDYCQRWKLLLTVERLRRKHLGGDDIIGLVSGTWFCAAYFRALGAKIGKDCCLYASGQMSFPLTEPDLVTIGDRCVFDDASLVAHINSRGNFKLNTLVVGDRCVMRSGSRLLSGASMRDDSCLLEHTLVMSGDETDAGATCQGWPADDFRGDRVLLHDETRSTAAIMADEMSSEEMTLLEKQGGDDNDFSESDDTSVDNRTWRSLDLGKWLGGEATLGRYQRVGSSSTCSGMV